MSKTVPVPLPKPAPKPAAATVSKPAVEIPKPLPPAPRELDKGPEGTVTVTDEITQADSDRDSELLKQAKELAANLIKAPADRVGDALEQMQEENPELLTYVQQELRALHAAKAGPIETAKEEQAKTGSANTFEQEQAKLAAAVQKQIELSAQLGAGAPSTDLVHQTAQKYASLNQDHLEEALHRLEKNNNPLFLEVVQVLPQYKRQAPAAAPVSMVPNPIALDFSVEPDLKKVLDVLRESGQRLTVKDVDRLADTGVHTRDCLDRLVAAGAVEHTWQKGRGVFRAV